MSAPFQIICPHCGATNLTPEERLGDQPNCGKCKQDLLPNRPIDVDGAMLQKHVSQSDLPLMVDFWAPWCGPCVDFAPRFAEFAQTIGYQLRCLKLDVQNHQEAAAQYDIRSIPTIVLFRDGREVDRKLGAKGHGELAYWVLDKLAQ